VIVGGSRARLLYGTDEAPTPVRRLVAGHLSAELEQGNLRAIRLGGVEIIRAISFLVRSPRWATYTAEISDLAIAEGSHSFHVTYRASVRDGDSRLEYAARIDGHAGGTLAFRCEVHAATDFVTCRTGFVVLHPANVAGRAVSIEHADGRRVESRFPLLIDPVQPMLDLRALTHEAAPNLVVTCRMEGDVFEMEDQRNWTDASFKTYVRPLSRPWPYTLPEGDRFSQSVTLAVAGATQPGVTGGEAQPIGIEAGELLGPMPAIGLGCTPQEAREALPHAATLARANVAVLVCRFDPGQGHTPADLAGFRALADRIGAAVDLQVVVHSVADFAAELQGVAASVREAGLTLRTLAVSPAPDLKSVTPGQPWPDCAPLDRLYAAARACFPGVALAGGTFAYFTELNRKRPPLDLLEAVTFSTSPLVHAADDRTVMESLEALPAIAASARAIAGDTPFVVGPSAIGLRDNPYGPAPLDNPGSARLAMSGADPRQRGLLNAAWTLGYIAGFAAGGAARIAVSAPSGPHGILGSDGVFPVFAVIRGCAALRGATLREVRISRPQDLAGLLAVLPDRQELWLANLTPGPRMATLPEPFHTAVVHRLDLEALQAAPHDPEILHRAAPAQGGPLVVCDPYAVLRVTA